MSMNEKRPPPAHRGHEQTRKPGGADNRRTQGCGAWRHGFGLPCPGGLPRLGGELPKIPLKSWPRVPRDTLTLKNQPFLSAEVRLVSLCFLHFLLTLPCSPESGVSWRPGQPCRQLPMGRHSVSFMGQAGSGKWQQILRHRGGVSAVSKRWRMGELLNLIQHQ